LEKALMGSSFRFPILIKVWAGESAHDMRYIRRSLPSLLASDLPKEARVILIDDCSPNPRLAPFLRQLAEQHDIVELWRNPERLGPNRGQEYNFPRVVAKYPDAPFYVMCDDDVIYHPGWLQRLIRVYEESKAVGLRGVFAALNTPFRPHYDTRKLPTSEVLLKQRQPALNWLVPRDVYEEVGPFRDTGVAFDTDYTNRLIELGLPVICMRPSYVQNIGYHGAYQNGDTVTAPDYVGRRDLYLFSRDCWYGMQQQTVGRLQDWFDNLPDSRWKRGAQSVARRGRKLLFRK
jgi:glycosyltransferase involved in cell wall biosynthesis